MIEKFCLGSRCSGETDLRNSHSWVGNFIPCSSVQLLSRFWLSVTSWTAACQVSLSITNSGSLHKLMSIDSVMPSNHLILCHPLLLPPPIFPSIRVFSNKSVGKSQYSLHLPPKYESPLSLFEPGFLRKLNGTWLEKMA